MLNFNALKQDNLISISYNLTLIQDLSRQKFDKLTALQWSIKYNAVKIFDALINVFKVDCVNERTLLHFACLERAEDIAKILIYKYKYNIFATDENGLSIFYYAIKYKLQKLIIVLLECGYPIQFYDIRKAFLDKSTIYTISIILLYIVKYNPNFMDSVFNGDKSMQRFSAYRHILYEISNMKKEKFAGSNITYFEFAVNNNIDELTKKLGYGTIIRYDKKFPECYYYIEEKFSIVQKRRSFLRKGKIALQRIITTINIKNNRKEKKDSLNYNDKIIDLILSIFSNEFITELHDLHMAQSQSTISIR